MTPFGIKRKRGNQRDYTSLRELNGILVYSEVTARGGNVTEDLRYHTEITRRARKD